MSILLMQLVIVGAVEAKSFSRVLCESAKEEKWAIITCQSHNILRFSFCQGKVMDFVSRSLLGKYYRIFSCDIAPDGRTAIFSAEATHEIELKEGYWDYLVQYDIGKKKIKEVLRFLSLTWPRWSPDGKLIAFFGNENNEPKYSLTLYNPFSTTTANPQT